MTEITLTDATSHLPPEIVGYVVLAVVMWIIFRKTYGEAGDSQKDLLDRYAVRLDQVERTLSHLSQELDQKNGDLARALRELADLRIELAAAQAAEDSCTRRMERLEARYERRIAELEHEIDQLRADLSEPILD